MAVFYPPEVVEEILSRLPVDSIVRFKCVCKSWFSLFQNPNFAAKHLSNPNQSPTPDHLFLMHDNVARINDLGDGYEIERGFDFCYLSKDIDDNYVHNVINVDLPPFIRNGDYLMLVGHCDGLIVFSDGLEDAWISNPATRELRTLPHSSFHPISFERPPYYENPQTYTLLRAMGFGYDSNTKDYKVVRVFQDFNSNPNPDIYVHRAEVFSISSDSSWRQINYSMNDTISFNMQEFHEGYYNGISYWLGTEGEMYSSEAVLISFHMGDDVFQTVPLPDDHLNIFEDYSDLVARVGVYNNEFIAMYTFYPRAVPGFVPFMDVWVMKEFGVKESWIKVLTIEPIPRIIRNLIVFWKNDKELLLEDPDVNLCSYDLVTKEFKNHGLGRTHGIGGWFVVPYMKTIVSVNTKEEGIVKDDYLC